MSLKHSMLNYHFTPTLPPLFSFIFFIFILLSFSNFRTNSAFNLTHILSRYPDLSDFTALLTTTGVSSALDHRTSVTILAVPNAFLRRTLPPSTSSLPLADVIRYHVLLQYLTWSDLRRIQPTGSLITTLFQTTGRAPDNLGSVNATFDPANGVVSFHPPNNNSMSTKVVSLLKTVPYNLSIIAVDSLIYPYDFDLAASETRPQQPPSQKPPPEINITAALINGHDFNVATSMLVASGVISEFEEDEEGAGITVFVPTDVAFSNLPATVNLQELSAEQKSLVLKFHVLHSYYPLGSLQSIVNPVQPTLATEDNGAGSFTLNISRVNGSVAINAGVVTAEVTQTVFDQKPVAIFGVSRVLLPKEVFGDDKGRSKEVSGPLVEAQPPDIGLGPEIGPTRLVSPSIGVAHSRGIGVWDEVVMVLLCVGGLWQILM